MNSNFEDLSTEELKKLVEDEPTLHIDEKQKISSEIARRESSDIESPDVVWGKNENEPKWKSSFHSNIYTENAVGWAAFLFGPIAPLYLIYKNYKSLNMKLHARIFALISSIFVIVFAATILTPASIMDKVPVYIQPIIIAIFAKLFVNKFQSKLLNHLLNTVKTKASILKMLLVGTASFLALILIAIPFSLMKPTIEGELLYIGKAKHEVFYEDSIPSRKARDIAAILDELGVLDSEFQTYLKIEKAPIGYRVLLPSYMDTSIEESKSYCLFLEFKLNNLYPNDFYQVKVIEDSLLGRKVLDCQ